MSVVFGSMAAAMMAVQYYGGYEELIVLDMQDNQCCCTTHPQASIRQRNQTAKLSETLHGEAASIPMDLTYAEKRPSLYKLSQYLKFLLSFFA